MPDRDAGPLQSVFIKRSRDKIAEQITGTRTCLLAIQRSAATKNSRIMTDKPPGEKITSFVGVYATNAGDRSFRLPSPRCSRIAPNLTALVPVILSLSRKCGGTRDCKGHCGPRHFCDLSLLTSERRMFAPFFHIVPQQFS